MNPSVARERQIVLASASPRRLALLESAGFVVTQRRSGISEEWPASLTPEAAVVQLAREKARAVPGDGPRKPILGADTEVILDGSALGKPESRTAAGAMLARLAGRTHTVYSGVALCAEGREWTGAEKTDVTFHPLSAEQIATYLEQSEFADKAGAYAIQEGGGLVKSFAGRLDTVIGLPMNLVERFWQQFAAEAL